MDIHAPESPVHSFKDFAIHISIVTCGILIALGLEGIRESVHERHLVKETRENFRHEMLANKDQMNNECARVGSYEKNLKSLVDDAPTLSLQDPATFAARLNVDRTPNYILSWQAWQAALSTGALAHMSTDEVTAYSSAADGIKIYSGLQDEIRPLESTLKANVAAHPHPNPDQAATEIEQLIIFYNQERGMNGVCPQIQSDIDQAIAATDR